MPDDIHELRTMIMQAAEMLYDAKGEGRDRFKGAKFNPRYTPKAEAVAHYKYTQRIIRAWIDKNLVDCENPRAHGKGVTANRSGQWRYRIGDYRLICSIEEERLVILALSVGHRSDIYKQ